MHKIIKFISIIVLALVTTNVFAEATRNATSVDTVKQAITVLMQQNKIPGVAVELFVNGEPYSYYFGYAKPNKNIPVTEKTIFEVGSISKLFTCLLLAQKIDYAKMNLSDSLEHYLRDSPDTLDDISLFDLATHTSGLPFEVPDTIHSRRQLMQYFADWTPEYNSSERWIYSNTGIGLLGYALEASSHRNYNQLYRRRILSPLRMQPIGVIVPSYLKYNYAQGYDKDGNPVPHVQLGLFPAAYGIKASSADMRQFLSAAIGLPGISPRIFYPMRMTQSAYIKLPEGFQGLGWRIHQLSGENVSQLLNESDAIDQGPLEMKEVEKPMFYGDALIDKTGGTNGFRSYIALIPNKKTGIVILTNKFVDTKTIVNTGREILFKLNGIAGDKR